MAAFPNSGSDCYLIFTDEKNFHEILTVGDKPAAFFDILAPPYHTETEEDEIRECYFFSELNVGSSNNNIHSDSPIMWLRRIKCPNDYVSLADILLFTESLVLIQLFSRIVILNHT